MRLNEEWSDVRGSVRWVAAAIALTAVGAMCSTAAAVELRVGDVLVAGHTSFFDGEDSHEYPAIVHIDPVTQAHVYLSGGGVGSGPEFLGPTGIAVKGNSSVYVSDGGRILRVDPATGDRMFFSGAGVGGGPAFSSTGSLWLREDDSLLVVDYQAKSIFAVDLASGDRTVVSSPTVGGGEPLTRPNHITTTLDGQILVTSYGAIVEEDVFNGFVVGIDPVTGDRSIFSDATHGSGPGYVAPIGISRRSNGQILVGDDWRAKIFEVDPTTREQTVFTESVPPATPVPNHFGTPRGVAEGPDGTVYFLDGDFGVMRVDANGGWASRIQGGVGVEIRQSNHITVVQVPEPAGTGLAAVGGAVVIAALARRQLRRQGEE